MMRAARMFCVALFVLMVCISIVYGVSIWIEGEPVSAATTQTYSGIVYYEFMFSVDNASVSGYPLEAIPFNMTCVVPVDVANSSDLNFSEYVTVAGKAFQFTGEVVTDNPSGDSVPVGYFVVSQIILPESEQIGSGWIATLKEIFLTVASVGKMTVTLIVQVVGGLLGVQVPDYAVALALVAALSMFFIKWGKKLPWILMLIAFLMCVALVSNLITGLRLF